MFIGPTIYSKPALQRSAMFRQCGRDRLTFRSSGARANLLDLGRSINITSLQDEENWIENFG